MLLAIGNKTSAAALISVPGLYSSRNVGLVIDISLLLLPVVVL